MLLHNPTFNLPYASTAMMILMSELIYNNNVSVFWLSVL